MLGVKTQFYTDCLAKGSDSEHKLNLKSYLLKDERKLNIFAAMPVDRIWGEKKKRKKNYELRGKVNKN
jgi:hypothetical protein